MRHVFTDQDPLDQRQSGPPRPGFLPNGNDLPSSPHVPSSPYSRKSNESHRPTDDASSAASNTHSSRVSSPDILDVMFIPSAPSLQLRPNPIKVVRESLESSEGISDRSPTTPEVIHQTFPETLQAFSPLFSANIGTARVPPLPPSSVGTSGTPLSAAQIRGDLRRGILNPVITRVTSLNTLKVSSSSNRTRMSPIPSAPETPQTPEVHKLNDVRKSSGFEAQQSRAIANLSTPSFSTPEEISPPPPTSSRRNSDPTGRVSRDLKTFAGQVELPEEIFPSTPEVREPDGMPLEGAPSQLFAPVPLEDSPSPSPSGRSPSVTEDERQPFTSHPQDNHRDLVSVGSGSRISTRGSLQSDNQARRPAPKQRLQPLDLPIVNADRKSTADAGAITKRSDASPGSHQGQGSAKLPSQVDTPPKIGAVPLVPADATTPVVTPTQILSTDSIRSSKTSEQLSPLVNLLPPPGLSSSHPSSNLSLTSTSNASTASSPFPPSQISHALSLSDLGSTPTPLTSRAQNISPPLPSSTLVSPVQHDRSNSLGVSSLTSFLRQSYVDLAAIHPPPPY